MNRREVLNALIRFEQPIADLEVAVSQLDWDAEADAILTRKDIASVVSRFLAGQLTAAQVERWANLLECREDIDFEPRYEGPVADAVFDLANPDLQGSLVEIADQVLVLTKS